MPVPLISLDLRGIILFHFNAAKLQIILHKNKRIRKNLTEGQARCEVGKKRGCNLYNLFKYFTVTGAKPHSVPVPL
jgi:hypothetical protein